MGTLDDNEEAELLRRWQEGCARSGEMLLERYFDMLFRFFRGRVDEDVAELVQRTLLACVERRERFSRVASVRAYLLGIARKELLMYLRKQARGRRALDRVAADRPQPTSPSVLVAAREEERIVLWAMRRLPAEQQLLLQLLYWEDLSIAEMASVLAVPAGTVKSRLHRARANLRDEIAAAPGSPQSVSLTIEGLDRWARSLGGRIEASSVVDARGESSGSA